MAGRLRKAAISIAPFRVPALRDPSALIGVGAMTRWLRSSHPRGFDRISHATRVDTARIVLRPVGLGSSVLETAFLSFGPSSVGISHQSLQRLGPRVVTRAMVLRQDIRQQVARCNDEDR